MLSICGTACCEECGRKKECGGCIKTNGHPLGGVCVAAEYVKKRGFDEFCKWKQSLIEEVNALGIKNLRITDLHLLNGFYVNLEYQLSNGQAVKLLEDNKIYWGNQIEIPGSDRCYGLVADEEHLLVCEYGCGGEGAEIVLYKKRMGR